MTNIYTTSSIGAFQACAKLYDLRVNKGYEAIDRPSYLVLGTLFHKAKEAWIESGFQLHKAKQVIKEANLKNEDIRCKAYAMIAAYTRVHKYEKETTKYHAIEHEFICNAGNNRKFAGICDAIVYRDSNWWILETKTAATVDESYFNRMKKQRQALMYVYALKYLSGDVTITGDVKYKHIAGVLYDFIQKPSLRRRKATPPEKRRYTKDGELYKGQREVDESDVDYINRMHDWYVENEKEVITRMEVVFTDNQIYKFAFDINTAVGVMEFCEGEGIWPPSYAACHSHNSPCEFVDYCWSADSPMVLDSFYRKREKRFAEFENDIGAIQIQAKK